MDCPRCRKAMRAYRVDGHLEREIDVDVCVPCQSIWFDAQEHLQLTPGAILTLFHVIGDNVARPTWQDKDLAHYPRCHAQLRLTKDLQRNTHFEYYRCPNEHGRLISFFDFLKEKDFVKPIEPHQIAELRKYVRTVECSNCGAAVDLAAHAHCSHCGSPLTILDIAQAERLVADLQKAETTGKTKTVDPGLALALERARQQAEAAFTPAERHRWSEDNSRDLVGDGLRAVMRLIRND